MTAVPPPSPQPERHKLYEDAWAMIHATLFVALGVLFYTHASLLFGSAAGMALLVSYVTGVSFGTVFFLINLPFYVLAWRRMGWAFTLRTFAAVTMVSVFSRLTEGWIDITRLDPLYATVVGGALCGTGLLMLFRHRTGLGGINILAMYLQERHGIRAGYLQLGIDLVILAAAFFVLAPSQLLLSVLGACIINMILAINHKPGRYLGVS